MITTAYTFITATLAAWIEREREFYMQQLKLVAERERERERQKATSRSRTLFPSSFDLGIGCVAKQL